MSEAGRWTLCTVAGALALLIALSFDWIPGLEGCNQRFHHDEIIIAYELVRSPEEVEALFAAGSCRAREVAGMRTALWLDILAFVPLYSAFLILALLGLRSRGRRLAWTAICIVAAAALLDQLENILLLSMLDDFRAMTETIAWLVPAVRGKFALLGLVTAVAGWLLAKGGGLGRPLGAVVIVGGLAGLALLVGDRFVIAALVGSMIAWPILLAVAARRAATAVAPA